MQTIEEYQLPNDSIIAIDGTSGSGKSTIAKAVAKILNMDYLETGSLYRSLTLKCLESGVDVNDESQILKLFDDFDFSFDSFPVLNGKDVSQDIKKHEIVLNVSQVSVHPKVREHLTQIIRHWIMEHNGGIIEGRDITTVVAPNAKLRVFVDADESVRAQRRQKDPKDNTEGLTKTEVLEGIAMRDKIDSTRSVAPLKRTDGVLNVDTSSTPLDENIDLIVEKYLES